MSYACCFSGVAIEPLFSWLKHAAFIDYVMFYRASLPYLRHQAAADYVICPQGVQFHIGQNIITQK
jgi:hypothetical protein